jgi:hypothetical protein
MQEEKMELKAMRQKKEKSSQSNKNSRLRRKKTSKEKCHRRHSLLELRHLQSPSHTKASTIAEEVLSKIIS